MQDLSDNSLRQIRAIFHEEIRPIIREEIRPILREEIRPMIREEMIPILAEALAPIKQTLGTHSLLLGELRADVSGLKTTVRAQGRDIHRLGVLFEDLDDRFRAASELLD